MLSPGNTCNHLKILINTKNLPKRTYFYSMSNILGGRKQRLYMHTQNWKTQKACQYLRKQLQQPQHHREWQALEPF